MGSTEKRNIGLLEQTRAKFRDHATAFHSMRIAGEKAAPLAYKEEERGRAPVASVDTIAIEPVCLPHSPKPNGRPFYCNASTIPPLIAVPQVYPNTSSPFVPAYPPVLLSHGVTEQSWRLFLEDASNIQAHKLPHRIILHGRDMAVTAATTTVELVKRLCSNPFKGAGKYWAEEAKDGGAASATCAIATEVACFPLAYITCWVAVPFVIGIVTILTSPLRRCERAAAYAAAINKKRLHCRGLHAQLMTSGEVAALAGISASEIYSANQCNNWRASEHLELVQSRFEPLILYKDCTLAIGDKTLWLVILRGKLFREAVMAQKRAEEAERRRHEIDCETESEEGTIYSPWKVRISQAKAKDRENQLRSDELELIKLYG
ncbi:hypothetical protein NLG97_g9647 [Lecanicillium saksenae]|uniref:Uncharacterized protein n=1 Tax=Lecanicillium saksenae TaxID=468837 RepID=A0ACC1QGX6_9HYPO|nr:hypothetical protein NLG97_g9647 [Lecanicillium saksenae]